MVKTVSRTFGIYLTRFPIRGKFLTMKIQISKTDRKLLMDAGYPRQTIYNWIVGRSRPSRLSYEEILRITGKDYRVEPEESPLVD